jgi:NAD(P)-dependent dehydrogenase (short-subunit alcohol dehydrogenase family)
MNIVVIGGGEEGKFGNDFCKRARSEGHRVLILSHKNYKNGDPDHHYADFSCRWTVVHAFHKLTSQIDNIDLFVFNTNRVGGPNIEDNFTSTASVDVDNYNTGLYYTVILPHLLTIEAFKKMSTGSKFVFLSTRMALDYKRIHYTEMAAYAGTKAYQIHLMISLSHHNDKGVIGTTVCPHFPYDEPENYKKVFDMVYNYILNFKKNGKVEFIAHFPDFDKF